MQKTVGKIYIYIKNVMKKFFVILNPDDKLTKFQVLDRVLTPLPKQIPFEKFNFLTATQF